MHPLALLPDADEDDVGFSVTTPVPMHIDGLNARLPFAMFDNDCWDFLTPGETGWMGPMPDLLLPLGEHLDGNARGALARDPRFLIVRVGRYLRFRRLSHGPAKKLADWKQMQPGDRLMISPEPTFADERLARSRCQYFRIKRFGNYKVGNDTDGSLWVWRYS